MSFEATAWAWTLDLPSTRKFVLMCLASYSDQEHACFPSQATIAQRCGLTRQTVNEAIAELEQLGLMRREHRSSSAGRASNRYVLNAPPITSEATLSRRGRQTGVGEADLGFVGEADTNLKKEESLCGVETPHNARARGSGFDRFWQAYPSKVGKRDAAAAFNRALSRIGRADPVAVMVEAVEAQKSSDRWRRGMVPNPATWLNQDRWLDELPQGTEPNGRHADFIDRQVRIELAGRIAAGELFPAGDAGDHPAGAQAADVGLRRIGSG